MSDVDFAGTGFRRIRSEMCCGRRRGRGGLLFRSVRGRGARRRKRGRGSARKTIRRAADEPKGECHQNKIGRAKAASRFFLADRPDRPQVFRRRRFGGRAWAGQICKIAGNTDGLSPAIAASTGVLPARSRSPLACRAGSVYGPCLAQPKKPGPRAASPVEKCILLAWVGRGDRARPDVRGSCWPGRAKLVGAS